MEGLSILAIDDDQDILNLISLFLTKKQHRVIQAKGGKEALSILSHTKPDLILLDVMMKDMSGYDVCSKIQDVEALSFIPVIFLTALSSETDRAKALSLGAVDFLSKPIKKELLYSVVDKHAATESRWRRFLKSKHDHARTEDTIKSTFTSRSYPAFCKFLFEFLNLSGPEQKSLRSLGALELQRALDNSQRLDATRFTILMAQFSGLEYLPGVETRNILLDVLPPKFSRHNKVIAISWENKVAFALADPFNSGLLATLESMKPAGLFVADLGNVLEEAKTYEDKREQGREIDTLAQGIRELYPVFSIDGQDVPGGEDDQASPLRLNLNASPLVRFVNTFIEKAYDMNASDIHIEPQENQVIIRFRIDGELSTFYQLKPGRLINVIASRIKIMAKMDISERRLPQDGRFQFKQFTERPLDFDIRVSSAPMNYGEKIVMRILDKQKALLPLESLGFSKQLLRIYQRQIISPYGMILHVGPTGSGKSMSLYSALNHINRPNINIQTAEDPIEYTLPGISQMQINPAIGLGFKEALRCFLRQDPDTILVGEIRDDETAQVAVEAALTGHRLLSTMHTNDAPSTVARFLEMGIPSYLISSTITLVCAQRLLRRLCPDCKAPYEPGDKESAMAGFPLDTKAVLYRSVGCPKCSNTGYKGRVGCFELLVPNAKFQSAMAGQDLSTETIRRVAVNDCGMVPLFQDAMAKVRDGVTSMAEAVSKVKRTP